MSLADRIPTNQRSLDGRRVFNILWLAGAAFTSSVIMLLLLQRLGIPLSMVLGATTIWIIGSVFLLSWFGRTMTSAPYFFADRLAGSAPLGLGGMTDWIGGAFLLLFFSATITGRMLLAPALMLGILLQASLFSIAFQRTGVSTLPGFFAWRSRSQLAGVAVLLVVITILSLLTSAEFIVARDAFSRISQMGASRSTWFIVVLAVVPTLFGGWLSLMIVNGVVSIWLLISVLIPAVVTGFFPNILRASLEREYSGQSIDSLQSMGDKVLQFSGEEANVLSLLIVIMVLSAGFSVLPHALSRLALNKRHIAAIESLGWSALMAFLLLSVLPLSIGLIGVKPSSATLAVLLKSQPVLHMLPHLAMFFAAFNALTVTMFALSSAIVRTLRRSRNLDPGEQSMFSTRLLAVVICLSLIFIPRDIIPPPGTLLTMALALGAGGIFVPLVSSIWLSSIPPLALILAVLAGAGVVVFAIVTKTFTLFPAGALGMLASGFVIFIGHLMNFFSNANSPDPRLLQLRQPDSFR